VCELEVAPDHHVALESGARPGQGERPLLATGQSRRRERRELSLRSRVEWR
jgi:hypothetical protein